MPAWFLPAIASGIGSYFGSKSKSKDSSSPSFLTQDIYDPVQQQVANPLASYLASRIGKSAGSYPGTFPEIDEGTTNRYNEFLGLNANDLFTKNIYDPAVKSFREDLLPIIREGYAGSLRGSGRFSSEEGAANKFSQDLAGLRYKANIEIPEAQFRAASQYYTIKQTQFENQYKAWADSLPENNPALKAALEFLRGSSGQATLSAVNPGQADSKADLVQGGIAAITTALTSGKLDGLISSISKFFGGS
jgi:hypothetical protein